MLRYPIVGTCNRTNLPNQPRYPTRKHVVRDAAMDGPVRATMTVSICPHGSWTEEAWVSDRPDDVDAAFAEIVADLRRAGVGTTTPDLDDLTDTSELPIADDPDGTPPAGTPSPTMDRPRTVQDQPTSWRGHNAEWDWSWGTDEDHYVPPEPPPLPRLPPDDRGPGPDRDRRRPADHPVPDRPEHPRRHPDRPPVGHLRRRHAAAPRPPDP